MRKKIFCILTVLLTVFGIMLCVYFSISFELTLETDGNGILYAEKMRVHPFSIVEVRIEPAEQYVLNSVTVNGEERTDDVHFRKLRFYCIWGAQTVYAVFQEENSTSLSSNTAIFV